MTDELKPAFDSWCILELMGHVRLAGRITEEERFGTKMGRIDVPDKEGAGFTTQYFGGGSVYRMTPTTEEVARRVAQQCSPAPVHPWEMPKQLAGPVDRDDDEYERDDGY